MTDMQAFGTLGLMYLLVAPIWAIVTMIYFRRKRGGVLHDQDLMGSVVAGVCWPAVVVVTALAIPFAIFGAFVLSVRWVATKLESKL